MLLTSGTLDVCLWVFRSLVIDKLEVVVPRKFEYAKDFASLYADIRGSKHDPFRSHRHYVASGDLRQLFGINAILYAHSKRPGGDGDHKLELLDTGRMGLSGMVREIESVFNCDATKLETRRVDCTADISAVPVSWFHDRVRAQFKRWSAKVGKVSFEVEFSEMGTKSVQTIYFGKRPNCYRIYDKVAEFRHQYSYVRRGVSQDADLPTFEECYGVSPDSVLTRVERQIAGGRVPDCLSTVDHLRRNAADFNPFERLKFEAGGRVEPRIDDYDLDHYAAGMWIRQQVEEFGFDVVYKSMLNRNGNGARNVRRYRDFLPSNDAAECAVTSGQLYDLYRSSTEKQLAA